MGPQHRAIATKKRHEESRCTRGDYNPPVPDADYNLALETSGRFGSFCLGRSDKLLAEVSLSPPGSQPRSGGGSSLLMVELEAHCRRLGIRPRDIRQVYLSIGPGSFTGLRVGVTMAKMLAMAAGATIVAVPTLRILACNTPQPHEQVVTCLNLKKETVYAGLFRRDGEAWQPADAPALRTMSELLQAAPRPVAVLGDPLPPLPQDAATLEGVTVLPASLAVASAQAVWRIGREMAAAGEFTDPWKLVPLYVRPPEAVELWNKRHGPEMVKT